MATSNQDNTGSKQSGNQGSSKQSGDTSKRGFASMDPQQQREIASEGGRAAHEKGTAHEFTSEEARRAGAMSHKNDQGSSQSSSGSSTSRSGGSAGNQGSTRGEREDERDDKARGGQHGGSSGSSRSGGAGGSSKT